MARTNQRGRKNNNPEGRNQFSNGWTDTAKDRPFATAAAAAAAVGAGVFLWSRRNQISDQISSLGEQIGEWTDSVRSGSDSEFGFAGGRSQEEISEEALTLKETGRKSRGPRGPLAQQDIKAGVAASNQEAKTGARAFS